MPPATATATVSLRELADLAIGTPEVGAVNFTALHTLIVAMLRSLNLQEVRINFQSPSPESSRSSELPRTALSAPQLAVPKEKPRSSSARPPALESQVKDLSKQLKTVTSQVQGIMSHVQHLTYPVGRLPVDSQDWPDGEMAVLLPDRARGGPVKIGKDGEQDGERASATKVSAGGRQASPQAEGGPRQGGAGAAGAPGHRAALLDLAGHGAAARCRRRCASLERSQGKGAGAFRGEVPW